MYKLVLPSVFLILLYLCPESHGAVPVVNGGNGPRFDRPRVPQHLRKNFDVFEANCSRCHTLERVASSFLTGVTPISGLPLDLDRMKGMLLDMMRKSARYKEKGEMISKEEIKSTNELLRYFLAESVR